MQSPTKPIWELPVPDSGSLASADDSDGDVTLKERLSLLQQERHRLVADEVCREAAKILV